LDMDHCGVIFFGMYVVLLCSLSAVDSLLYTIFQCDPFCH